MTQNGRTINTSINELIEQELIEDASNSKKFQHLLGLLDEALPVKVLIFLEAKKSVGPLARRIKSEPQFDNITDFLTSDRTVRFNPYFYNPIIFNPYFYNPIIF
jgi:superfamily II DNA/RNA helicase